MQTDINEANPSVGQAVETAPSSVPPQQEPKKKSKALTIVVIALLAIPCLAAAVYAGYYFSSSDKGDSPEPESFQSQEFEFEEQEEESEPVPTSSEYMGEYITAELPESWQIIEYENGDGSDMLMGETEYIGLTGISILTDEEEEVFQVYAVMGIGGIDVCTTVGKFSDTPDTYIDEVNNLTIEYNSYVQDPEPMPVVNEITDEEYVEVSFLDYRGRRVEGEIYWNDLDNVNQEEFHPLCGLPSQVLVFESLLFEYGGPSGFDVGNSYAVRIVGDPSEEVLLILDQIISSITLNN